MSIRIEIHSPLEPGVLKGYWEANCGLPLPLVANTATKRRLAIVGSGLSIRKRFHELVDFDGDLWAINGAWPWLHKHGLEATFFTVDPMPIVLEHSREAKDVVLAAQCDPALFQWHMAKGHSIRRWDGRNFGVASSHGAAFAAIEADYEEVFFYGCECSFIAGEDTHVNTDKMDPGGLLVECGGEDFYTRAAYYGQAMILTSLIAPFPGRFEERSGGLLGAMVKEARKTPVMWDEQHTLSMEASR